MSRRLAGQRFSVSSASTVEQADGTSQPTRDEELTEPGGAGGEVGVEAWSPPRQPVAASTIRTTTRAIRISDGLTESGASDVRYGVEYAADLRADRIAALTAALTTVVLWASAFVGIRSAGNSLSPGPLTLGRLLVGVAALGLVALARREPLPRRVDLGAAWAGLLVCGLLWFGVYNVALNSAERRVDAGTAAMLVNVGPIVIAVLAGLFLGEGFPRRLFIGLAIAFAGVIVIGAAVSSSEATKAGVVLCLVAAVSYAAAVVAQKPVLRRLAPLQTILLCCLIGAAVCLPFAPQLADELRDADPGAIAWMVYLGVFPTALAFTTWAYALARTGAGRMGAITYLVPPISVLLGWLVLDESPPALALAGGAVCLLGVVVARRG